MFNFYFIIYSVSSLVFLKYSIYSFVDIISNNLPRLLLQTLPSIQTNIHRTFINVYHAIYFESLIFNTVYTIEYNVSNQKLLTNESFGMIQLDHIQRLVVSLNQYLFFLASRNIILYFMLISLLLL